MFICTRTGTAVVIAIQIFYRCVGTRSQAFGAVGQDGACDSAAYTTQISQTTHDEVAALEAELDLLRAQLAKSRHHKKPYEGMTSEEYRAALDKLGLSIVGSAEYLGLSRRQSQRYANGATPVAVR